MADLLLLKYQDRASARVGCCSPRRAPTLTRKTACGCTTTLSSLVPPAHPLVDVVVEYWWVLRAATELDGASIQVAHVWIGVARAMPLVAPDRMLLPSRVVVSPASRLDGAREGADPLPLNLVEASIVWRLAASVLRGRTQARVDAAVVQFVHVEVPLVVRAIPRRPARAIVIPASFPATRMDATRLAIAIAEPGASPRQSRHSAEHGAPVRCIARARRAPQVEAVGGGSI